jgi:enoyl-CoA hydratase/carnithine racemase
MTAYTKIKTALEGPAYRITLFNPERRNAIGPVMVNELLYALEEAEKAEGARAIVITGEGKAFCAGGDFSQMTSGADANELPHKGDYADLLLAMTQCQLPIIARVNGPAMGGGLGIVAASTFAIGQSDATLGTPEVNVGLFPMMIMAVLTRVVPRRKLMEMMFLGEKMTADQALASGLLGSVVPAEGLDAAVDDLVKKLASKSPITLKLGLRAFAEQDDMDLAAALPMLRGRLGEVLGTDDAREGLMAFLQKRPPQWTGK